MLSEMAEKHRAPSAHHPLLSLRSAPFLPSRPPHPTGVLVGRDAGLELKVLAFLIGVPKRELKPSGHALCLGLHTACSCCPGGVFRVLPLRQAAMPRAAFPTPLLLRAALCRSTGKDGTERTGDAFGAARPAHSPAAQRDEFGPAGTGAEPVLGATRRFLRAESTA